MARGKRITLCVFIDAFGWELAKRFPFLDDILTLKTPLETIFGYSSTCDPTILTGVLPREHMHFTFFTYDPEHSPFKHYRYFGILPRSIMQRGRVRGKLSQIMKRVHGFTGYFQLYNMPFRYLHLFDYTERYNIFEPGGINGGQPTIFDFARDHDIAFCRPAGYEELESVAEVEQAMTVQRVPFVYLFLGKLDATLHAHGTQSPKSAKHLAWYETLARRVCEKARETYDEVKFYVFSDHGMTDITSVCDLMGVVDRLGLTFAEDYVAAYDSTIARFWFLNDRARDAITKALASVPQGHIMGEEELASYGCDFPGHRFGQLFFLMNPGVLLCPSHMGVKPLAAMHGYTPQDKDSTAAFMSNVTPAVMPKRLDDLYTLIHSDLATSTSQTVS